ncbi:gliding motility-associated C-terminal domain-containing protein [Roseivirga sp.]|uniref:gliding motility-associated C-terminal domain-containing protein n=1 Tax=Roseivirga sp. TaxID=1964215 RepID=UPI003B52EC4E
MCLRLLYGLLFSLPVSLAAQGNLLITENTHFSTSANTAIHIIDTELSTEGNLNGKDAEFNLTSSQLQTTLGGTGTTQLGKLYLSAPNGEFLLESSMQINSLIALNEGNLNLQGNNLILTSTESTIEGESNNQYIYSLSGGRIIKTLTLNQANKVNPGNLGISITSNDNLGLTEIHRIHESSALPTGTSIRKSFEIFSENQPISPLDIGISYFDIDVIAESEEPEIWKLTADGDWKNIRTSLNYNNTDRVNTAWGTDKNPSLVYTVGPEKIYPVDISSIPTAFTPNDDGINDTFIIPFIDEDFIGKVTIISRWGDILYSTDNYYAAPWGGKYKGKAMPVATYYYVLTFSNDQHKEIKGNISIVR